MQYNPCMSIFITPTDFAFITSYGTIIIHKILSSVMAIIMGKVSKNAGSRTATIAVQCSDLFMTFILSVNFSDFV